ncbi:MAG: response regulator, partial [Nitrospirota bacterium]|nr:response regulator [Nitrospirota bacterium]
SAGTFGYDLISELARGIEAHCDEILDLDAPTAAERTERISELLARLGPAVDITRTSKEGGYATNERASAPRRRDKLIALLDSDPEQAQALAVQIEESGYCVRIFLDPDSAIRVFEDAPPAAILMSLYFVKGRKYGIEAAQRIREGSAERVPLIFLSASNDFETRLSAVRAGADAYLVKPPRLASLIDLLDRAILGRSARPCHVLVFTSDDATASQICSALEADGMVVHVLRDTAEAIETIGRFQPEVILADAYMPQCTGLELAQVIRQDDAHAAIPIVFLVNGFVGSSNLLGLGLEDGDYLVKSFDPSALVELVAIRARQARVDRVVLAKDNLAKVLSQPSLLERFNREAEALGHTSASLPTAAQVDRPPRRKILVVDDDP